MLRLSWEMTKAGFKPEAVKTMLSATVSDWSLHTIWTCSYYPLSFPVNRLVSAFLDAAQYTLVLPLGLLALVGFFKLWSVPGFFRKCLYFPYLIFTTFAVFVAACAGIHFVSVPLGIAGLFALFLATFLFHIPQILTAKSRRVLVDRDSGQVYIEED